MADAPNAENPSSLGSHHKERLYQLHFFQGTVTTILE